MILKKSLIGLMLVSLILTVSSCDKAAQLPIEAFDDILLSKSYTPKWGSTQGIKAIYQVYGTNPSGLKEGTAVGFDHKFIYRIKDLLKANNSYISPEAQAAVLRQEKLIP